MKKSFSKLPIFALALSLATILLALPSCKSLSPTTIASAASMASTTIHTRDTIFLRDSIFISERQRGDTVYLTRTEYRDRWRTQIVHDTVLKTDSIVEVIEHPPREVIPPFYKRCTAIFWTLMALLLLYVIVRTRYSIK